MIRPSFLDPESCRDLIELVWGGSASHRLARRARMVLESVGLALKGLRDVVAFGQLRTHRKD
jgi:hypothetical protein